MVPEIARVIDHRRIARDGISTSVKLRSHVLRAREFRNAENIGTNV